jgi:hypothetical protein
MRAASALALAAVVAAYLLALSAFLALPAAAQTQCGPRDHVLRFLARDHHEGVTGRGLAANGHLIEITVGPKGTWTMLHTTPTGVSCILATGTGWEAVKDVLGVPG